MKLAVLLFLPFVFLSCFNNQCKCNTDPEILRTNDSIINKNINPLTQNVHERHWQRFDEPMLYKQEVESYRLSISYTFEQYMKIYRIQAIKNSYELTIKEFAIDNFGSRPDSLVSKEFITIDQTQWTDFLIGLDTTCFWTFPVTDETRYLDPTTWILEGYNPYGNPCTAEKFHFIRRDCPQSRRTGNCPQFLAICNAFFKFESLEPKQF